MFSPTATNATWKVSTRGLNWTTSLALWINASQVEERVFPEQGKESKVTVRADITLLELQEFDSVTKMGKLQEKGLI